MRFGKRLGPDDFLTLVVPEVLESRGLLELVSRPALHRLKAALLTEPGVQVLDVPLITSDAMDSAENFGEPARNYAIVLVSGVHNATLQAIEYAETLRPTDLRAVSFGLDPFATERLGDECWRPEFLIRWRSTTHPSETSAHRLSNTSATSNQMGKTVS